MENLETEIPPYAQIHPREDETRMLVFEAETNEVIRKELSEFGLCAVGAWTDDKSGRVAVDRGTLVFRVHPGYSVFVAVKAAS